MAAVLPAYERLQAAVDRATDDLDAVEDELRLAREQTAHLAPQMTAVAAHVVPRVRTVGKGVGIAAAAGLIGIRSVVLVPDEERDARRGRGWERGRVPRADLTTRDAVRGGVWISRS